MTDAIDWTGAVGDIWAAEWRRTDRSLADLGKILNAAAVAAVTGLASPRILDIGCGAGATSLALAAALPTATITGVDISAELAAVARARAKGQGNLAFEAAPVEEAVSRHAPIDLFVSRHGVMFFADPVAAFTKIRQSAAPGGRLLFTCFQPAALNPWATEMLAEIGTPPQPEAAGYQPGPFAFADPAFVTEILGRAGWRDATATSVDFTYRVGEGADPVADGLAFLSRIGPAARALRTAPEAQRETMVAHIAAVLARHRSGDAVDFPAAAWLWSAHNEPGEAA